MIDTKQDTTSSETRWRQIQWATASTGLGVIAAALLYKVLTSPAATSPADLIAVCIMAILFALSSNFDNISMISFGNFRVELDSLKHRVSQNEQVIADLLLMSMGPSAYENLKKLADGTFREYKKPHYQGLETELYHLRNLGYIELRDGTANSIFEIPENDPPDLLHYIKVTPTGRSYIMLREEREPAASVALRKWAEERSSA